MAQPRPRRSELVYHEIRNRILWGQLAAESRLSDAALADELSTSRAPVREALRRLASEGLVIDRPQRGTFVRKYTVHDAVDLHELRVILETSAAEKAIEREEDVAPLERLLEAMRTAARVNNVRDFVDAEFKFHQTIVGLSGNRWLMNSYMSVSDHIQMIMSLESRSIGKLREEAEEHVALIELIRDRRHHNAKAVIRSHIMASMNDLIRVLSEVSPTAP